MLFGIDWLGGCRYADLVLREHPEGWSAGFFANTFGNAWPVIERLAATGRAPRIRVHAVWDDAHRYRPVEHDKIIKRTIRRMNELKVSFPAIDWQHSWLCENSVTGPELERVRKMVESDARGLTLVNASMKAIAIKGWVTEIHGKHKRIPGRYNHSDDGNSACDLDYQSLKDEHANAETKFMWHAAMNGKLNDGDKTPRPNRKAWPTSQLVESIIYLHRDKGDFPNLGRQWIFKTHADRHSTPPADREYKPVLICPVSAPRFEMVADNDQVIATSGSKGTYTDGRPLYRFGDYGYQIAEKAHRIQGHSVVRLRANGKFHGSINSAFRAGDYR